MSAQLKTQIVLCIMALFKKDVKHHWHWLFIIASSITLLPIYALKLTGLTLSSSSSSSSSRKWMALILFMALLSHVSSAMSFTRLSRAPQRARLSEPVFFLFFWKRQNNMYHCNSHIHKTTHPELQSSSWSEYFSRLKSIWLLWWLSCNLPTQEMKAVT